MNIIDIILLLAVLIPGAWTGLRKGFTYQVVTLLALFLGAWMSYHFATSLGSFLGGFIKADPGALRVVSYVIIFAIVYFILYLLSKLILKVVKIAIGGWVDKLFGLLLGLFKAAMIGALLLMLFDTVNSWTGLVSKEDLNASKAYCALQRFGQNIFPYLKAIFSKGNA